MEETGVEPLRAAIQAHLAAPFPDSVERGEDYGEVCAVMIDSDVYGWALRAADAPLSDSHRARCRRDAERLARSISHSPDAAQAYYRRVLDLAHLALNRALPR